MSDLEPQKHEDEDQDDWTTGYTTTAIGVGLLIAAFLVIITAGTPAAGIGFVIGAAACLGWGIPQVIKHRNERKDALPTSNTSEKELLSAIRDNGGSITPAEAAMETSLTIREADQMLSDLTGEGHLTVESRDGALFYVLPGRRDRELGG